MLSPDIVKLSGISGSLIKSKLGNNNNNNNNNNNFIYTVNYPISNTAGINGRTVFMNILTGIYSHICY